MEPLLPAFEDYSPEQMFFLAAAQVNIHNFHKFEIIVKGTLQIWCENTRSEVTEQLLLLDVHSPCRFRVNGPVSNSPEFSEAYKCKLGSPMNPPIKNVVW